MTHRILLVCLGNICRSPTAEGVVRAIAAREFPGLPLYVDSAGTANYHVGEPPDRRTIAAARRRGYELAALRARQVCAEDFVDFDYVLAMDRANLAELGRLAGESPRAQLGLFLQFAPEAGSRRGARPVLRRHGRIRTRARPVRVRGSRPAATPERLADSRAPQVARGMSHQRSVITRRGAVPSSRRSVRTTRPRRAWTAAGAADRAVPVCPRCVPHAARSVPRVARHVPPARSRAGSSCGRGSYSSARLPSLCWELNCWA